VPVLELDDDSESSPHLGVTTVMPHASGSIFLLVFCLPVVAANADQGYDCMMKCIDVQEACIRL
jgi:hypothetical protein